MAEQQYTWTAAQFRAHEVLVAAGFDGEEADRAVNELGRAGLTIAESVKRFDSIEEMRAGGMRDDIARTADGRMRRADDPGCC